MTLVKEFSYSNINQRRIVLVNTFISAFLTVFIMADFVYSIKYYFFYFPVIRVLLLFVLSGLFLGNLAGRFLFSVIRFHRVILIISEIAFSLLCAAYLSRFFLMPDVREPLFSIFSMYRAALPLFCAVLCFFLGVKFNYFLKICTGNFIDEKHGAVPYIMLLLLGILMGISVASLHLGWWFQVDRSIVNISMSALALVSLVSAMFLNLSYNPDTMYAQHYYDEGETPSMSVTHRDDLFFTYLNFSYIFIYLYLGYESYVKFYGDLFYHKAAFNITIAAGLLAGFVLGRLVRTAFWHIYSEMIFPVFFLLYIFLVYNFSDTVPFYYALGFIVPAAMVFGFAVYKTVETIISRFDHARRFNILYFSIFVLPVPILVSLCFTEFTYRWYFILIYVVTLVNIVIPGIYFINRNSHGGGKIVYFIFSLIFIPMLVFMHIYFKIPLNSVPYVSRVKNFNELKSTNYNALYIKSRADVTVNDTVAYRLSDSVVRNMKRAFLPVYVYHPENKKILIIDGNQKFFRHPAVSYFNDALCLDPVPSRFVDHDRLPVTGQQLYVPEEEYVLIFLGRSTEKYASIVDSPNLLDVQLNMFRFSTEYYEYIKNHLQEGGIFTTMFNINSCNTAALSQAVVNLRRTYRHHLIYLFSNIMVVLSSDSDSAFDFSYDTYKKLSDIISRKKEMSYLFYSEGHFFSNLLFRDISDLLPYIRRGEQRQSVFHAPPLESCINMKALNTVYTAKNNRILEKMDREKSSAGFVEYMYRMFSRDSEVLTLLKETEVAEAEERYTDEMSSLFQLNRYAEYKTELRPYIKTILSYKEEYYYNAALILERKKDWEGARKLYQAILTIDRDNFDANYRLGLLSLTLQDMEASFRYLQYALTLKKDHPKALYQMGVLLFSSGRPEEAIDYLNQALNQHEKSSQIFFYLGLAYEKIGKMPEAKVYYERAIIEDPNDLTIQARLQSVNAKIEEERNKWKTESPRNEFEAEQDEDIPLPINKSAYDIRLEDSNKNEK